MITKRQQREGREKAARLMREAGVVFQEKELEKLEVADFGLSRLETEGAQIFSLFDTKRLAARVITLFPYQTEPEHWHEPEDTGKEETFRVIAGTLLLYVDGEDTLSRGKIPEESRAYYTCRHELVLGPGDTVTLEPGKKHWFQAGEEPVVFYSMSTTASDARDPFTDPHIVRVTQITE